MCGIISEDCYLCPLSAFSACLSTYRPFCCRLSDGPLATIHLPHHLPASFHGSFSAEYLGPDPADETVLPWTEPNRVHAI